MREFVLQHPGAVNAAIGVAQPVQQASLSLGAVRRMHPEEPSQALDALALLGAELAPLLFSHLIDRLGKRLGDVEVIDDEGGVRAMMLDRLGVGAAHIAARPADAPLLPLAQALVEEPVDGLASLARAYPYHPGAIEVVADRGEFAAFAEGDLVRPRVRRPRMEWPSRTRSMIRCSRFETVEAGSFSTAAAVFWVISWQSTQMRHSSRYVMRE